MSATVQFWIVIVCVAIAFGYAIYKAVNMVRNRNASSSPCCSCDIPCKARELKGQKRKK